MTDIPPGAIVKVDGEPDWFVPFPNVKEGWLYRSEEEAWDMAGKYIAMALQVRRKAREQPRVDKVVEWLKGVHIYPELAPRGQTWDAAARDLIQLVKGLGD